MHFICNIDDIEEGTSKGFNLNGNSVFGVKKHGRLYFYKNSCPHLGAELEWMDNEFLTPDGNNIRCQFHGALFEISDGQCVSGPCKGDYLQPLVITLKNDSAFWLETE